MTLVADDGHLVGPFDAMLLQLALGHGLQTLGLAVRYETPLSARPAVTDTVSARCGSSCGDGPESAFELCAHERIGRRAGLSDGELTALRRLVLDGFAGASARSPRTVHALAERKTSPTPNTTPHVTPWVKRRRSS